MTPYTTAKDKKLVPYVETCLKAAGLSALSIEPFCDYVVESIKLNLVVLWAKLSTPVTVFDAWVIYGGGNIRYYNYDNYRDLDDAIASHVGYLVLGNKLKVCQ